ncbi:MAG: hypothetical protein QXY52_05920 [Conexivisphaerales archaeon]
MNEGKRGKPYAYSDALMLLAVKEWTSGRPRAFADGIQGYTQEASDNF